MAGTKFEALDCYNRRVYCSMGLWYGKLLTKHGITDKDEKLVRLALRKPDGGCPRYDYEDPKRMRIYYKQEPETGQYIKVVVKFRRDRDEMVFGEVVSAYFETFLNDKEKHEDKNDESF